MEHIVTADNETGNEISIIFPFFIIMIRQTWITIVIPSGFGWNVVVKRDRAQCGHLGIFVGSDYNENL